MGFSSMLQAMMPFTAFFGGKCGKFQKKVKGSTRVLLAYKCVCKDGYVRSGNNDCVAIHIPPYTNQKRKKSTTKMNTVGKTTSTSTSTTKTTSTSTSTTKTTSTSTTKRTSTSTTKRTTTNSSSTTSSNSTSWWPTWLKTTEPIPHKHDYVEPRTIPEEHQIWSTSEAPYYLDGADFATPEATTVSLPIHVMSIDAASTMTTPLSWQWHSLMAGDQ